jgi:hypothetical protein
MHSRDKKHTRDTECHCGELSNKHMSVLGKSPGSIVTHSPLAAEPDKDKNGSTLNSLRVLLVSRSYSLLTACDLKKKNHGDRVRPMQKKIIVQKYLSNQNGLFWGECTEPRRQVTPGDGRHTPKGLRTSKQF